MLLLYPWMILRIRAGLAIAGERLTLIVKHIKDGQELGDRQKILDFLRQFQKLERTAFFFDSRKARYELADAARIYVADTAQIDQDLIFAFAKQAADSGPKGNADFADSHFSIKIQYRDITRLALRNCNISHFSLLV